MTDTPPTVPTGPSGPIGPTRATGFEEYVAARSAALLRTAYLLTGQRPTPRTSCR